jgi:hypothetical protein
MWTLEEGLEVVRLLQPGAAERGFNLSLGGGVLNKGTSLHDLDIVAAPAKDAKPDVNTFLLWLSEGLAIGKLRPWNSAMLVVTFMDDRGRKIDFFIVDAGGIAPPKHWLQVEADRKVAEGH